MDILEQSKRGKPKVKNSNKNQNKQNQPAKPNPLRSGN